jgi:hypothetical protein
MDAQLLYHSVAGLTEYPHNITFFNEMTLGDGRGPGHVLPALRLWKRWDNLLVLEVQSTQRDYFWAKNLNVMFAFALPHLLHFLRLVLNFDPRTQDLSLVDDAWEDIGKLCGLPTFLEWNFSEDQPGPLLKCNPTRIIYTSNS